MEIVKQDKFVENLSVYVKKQIFTELEVNNKIDELEKKIQQLSNASKKEKRKIEKQLNSGEEVIKENNNLKKYILMYFYNKKDQKIILKNIIEYEREEKYSILLFDIFLSLFALYKLSERNYSFFGIVRDLIIFLNCWTLGWYYLGKENCNNYRVVGNNWLDKLLLDLDSVGKVQKFRISRSILFYLLFVIYSVLLGLKGNEWYIGFIYIICNAITICTFINNLFKLTRLNFLYFIGIIFIAILTGTLKSTNWEAVVALLAIVSLLFSDEIWKFYPNYENPLEGKYRSKKNKVIVERNIFKYKLTLSVISLIFFITLKLIENNKFVESFFAQYQDGELKILISLFSMGMDRIIVGSIIFVIYALIVKLRKKLLDKGYKLEKPIVDSIFQFIYKDLKISSPVVKKSIDIDSDLAEIFEPRTLIENLDELPDDIIVSMKKPVTNGENILFIHSPDGRQLLKERIKIKLANRK